MEETIHDTISKQFDWIEIDELYQIIKRQQAELEHSQKKEKVLFMQLMIMYMCLFNSDNL